MGQTNRKLLTMDYLDRTRDPNLKIFGKPRPDINQSVFTLNSDTGKIELAAETTGSTVADSIPTIIQGTAEAMHERATARKIFPVVSIAGQAGNTVTIPRINEFFTSVGKNTAQASELDNVVAIDTGSALVVKVEKYDERVDLVEDAIEDSILPLHEIASRRLGEAIAEYEDRDIYSQMYNQINVGNRTDKSTGGWDASTGWQTNITNDITNALEAVENNDLGAFKPSHIICNTSLAKYLRRHDDFKNYAVYGGQAGSIHDQKATELHGVGIQGNIYGLDLVTTKNLATSLTRGTGEDSFAVVDATQSVVLFEKRPFTIKQMNWEDYDEIHLTATLRSGSGVIQEKAAAMITDCLSPS